MNNVETPLTALLAKLDTSIYEILRVTEVHAILDSHIICVRVTERCECACCDIVPNL